MSDSITSLFSLKDSDVEICTEELKAGIHHFRITLVNRGGRCPRCGRFTKDIKEYRTKVIRHSIFLNEQALVHYRTRRFLCPDCGKTFYEDDPFSSQYCHISDKTVGNVLKLAKDYFPILMKMNSNSSMSFPKTVCFIAKSDSGTEAPYVKAAVRSINL